MTDKTNPTLGEALNQAYMKLNSAVVALHGYEDNPEVAALMDAIRDLRKSAYDLNQV